MSFHDCDLAVIKSLKPYKNGHECSFNLMHKGRDDSFFFSFLRQMDLLDCEKNYLGMSKFTAWAKNKNPLATLKI